MKKILSLGLILALALALTACGEAPSQPTETTAAPVIETTLPPETTETVPPETQPQLVPASLEELEVLLGLEDEVTAEDLGGGEENWTADKSTYIGRIYHVSLMGRAAKVFTSCDNKRSVASVSAWVTDGTTEVTEEEVQFWVQTLTEYAGSDPISQTTSEESGSQNWKWKKDKNFITLHWLGDIVSIDMLPAIGKIK